MKTFVAIVSLLVPFISPAQSYAIDWHKVAAGGGTSTNGQYSLSGTIGQADAGGPMTNSQYSVTGGFWVLPQAVQTVGAPTLQIVAGAPGFATVSWAPATPGFHLQVSDAVALPAWTDVPGGTNSPVIVPATLPAKFYRLTKP
jgi:hypothetical protein